MFVYRLRWAARGGAADPEQLFAVGYGACFQSALDLAGRRLGFDTSGSTVTARVSMGPSEGGNYGLAVELVVTIPDLDHDSAMKTVLAAHDICPYSNAVRDNIEGHSWWSDGLERATQSESYLRLRSLAADTRSNARLAIWRLRGKRKGEPWLIRDRDQ